MPGAGFSDLGLAWNMSGYIWERGQWTAEVEGARTKRKSATCAPCHMHADSAHLAASLRASAASACFLAPHTQSRQVPLTRRWAGG